MGQSKKKEEPALNLTGLQLTTKLLENWKTELKILIHSYIIRTEKRKKGLRGEHIQQKAI